MNVDKVTNLHKNNEVQFFCFKLHNDANIYAINVFKVREIIKYGGLITQTNMGNLTPVEGIISVRDEVIPLLNIKTWFLMGDNGELDCVDESNGLDSCVCMICEFSKYLVALRIEAPFGILSKKWSEIYPFTEATQRSRKSNNHTKYLNGELVLILDVEKMLVDIFPWMLENQLENISSLEKVKSKKMLLVAEDSPVAKRMLREIFERIGIKFRDFENGQLLLDYLFALENIDNIGLIITDLEMPIASGFEVTKQIREKKNYSHIPIIINSSMSGESNKHLAISLNADGFVTSKNNPEELEQFIKKYLV